jgi:hypothetical protein
MKRGYIHTTYYRTQRRRKREDDDNDKDRIPSKKIDYRRNQFMTQ